MITIHVGKDTGGSNQLLTCEDDGRTFGYAERDSFKEIIALGDTLADRYLAKGFKVDRVRHGGIELEGREGVDG